MTPSPSKTYQLRIGNEDCDRKDDDSYEEYKSKAEFIADLIVRSFHQYLTGYKEP